MSFLTHLECANCFQEYDPDQVHNLCAECQRPLLARYDLAEVKKVFSKKELASRPPTIWRYLEMLPIDDSDNIVSLVETITPILPAKKLAAELGVERLYIKDEGRLPTGSFKSRGMTVAISKAKELGITRVAVPSAGNAGGAMAAYAARAGMEAYVFMPVDSPIVNQKECLIAGAKTYLIDGLISDCGRIVSEGVKEKGWFDFSTLREPYRLEGKKTMGFELAEQFDWELPDVILYPTGGGTGLIGMWKAFTEMDEMGWLKDGKKPRLIACQSSGCAPIVEAFNKGERFAKRFDGAQTVASGIRVPSAIGDFLILDAVRESGGHAVAIAEQDISKWMAFASGKEGISLCPESAVCLGALETLLKNGAIKSNEHVLIFNTGAGHKYPEAVPQSASKIVLQMPISWAEI